MRRFLPGLAATNQGLATAASCGCLYPVLFAAIAACGLCAKTSAADADSWASQIEKDWARQHELRYTTGIAGGPVTPEQDARGGCDGIKNGEWGFHTENEMNPWWQVDLGKMIALDRVVLYNRTGFESRASKIIVLLSADGREFDQVYQHDGTPFQGFKDTKPLSVALQGRAARYVRLTLPEKTYFHLDEVEVYDETGANVALNKPATQSSISQWSKASPGSAYPLPKVLGQGRRLASDLKKVGVDCNDAIDTLDRIERDAKTATPDASRALLTEAHWAIRRLALKNPLLDFDTILFVKRAPGMLPHMSDQYYGWWSRPGGGIFLLEGFKTGEPRLRCLTPDMPEGNFLRPDLSWDARKVLFAYCRHYPDVHTMEKVDKDTLPEDAFYQIYEMNLDGSGRRQLTRGRYEDFDARYLPDGRIVFLSTRKGQFVQCNKSSAQATTRATLPDSYVRCGGDNKRPCAVFTLHAMDADGGNLRAISAFENFEWTPSVAADGRILYARWDYIDRFNGHFMSLWSTNPDGTNGRLVYGNYTTKPQCVFEARAIPGSRKLVFTAAAHHSIMGGSLALLDRNRGAEGPAPVTRLTPEVIFPETEGWQDMYYANPWPLSENYFLVAWSDRHLPPHRGSTPVKGDENPVNATGIYLYDAFGNLEILHRDPEISSMYPIPVRPRPRPPAMPDSIDWDGAQKGLFLVQDIYEGLDGVPRETIRELRIVGVAPKVQPHMNSPVLGVSKEDPGKFILGNVPVEADGSAYFWAPSGVSLFFQALDCKGVAVQTMRSLTYVQPGQTLSCVGCHESRDSAPPVAAGLPLAARRAPSRIEAGPAGTWPLRYDQLVQPVLDRACVRCHAPGAGDAKAAAFDLTGNRSYENLIGFADKDLEKLAFERDFSEVGKCVAQQSRLLATLQNGDVHRDVQLSDADFRRLVIWMDTYAHRLGSFSPQQEEMLYTFRHEMAGILEE